MTNIELINEAKKAREKAYTPYSNFMVALPLLPKMVKSIMIEISARIILNKTKPALSGLLLCISFCSIPAFLQA